MTAARRGVLADLEVIELLANRPDLLAVADAVAATQQRTRARRARLAPLRFLGAAAAIGVVVAVALVSPWGGRGALVDRALAAIGSRDVVHVVETAAVPRQSVVDLRTGAESPVVRSTEIWFDSERGLLRSVQRIGDTVTGEVLETPAGAWTAAGRVYTCAWIAAHSTEATKLRVSCNPSSANGTVPRHVPEPRPVLAPSLTGFVTGYREALERGEATQDGHGVVAGREIEWLRFPVPGSERVERVAVDAETLAPVRLETLVDGKLVDAATISLAETLDRVEVTFPRPKPTPPGTEPVSTRLVDERQVPIAEASSALEGRLVDAGARLAGLPRRTITVQTIVSGYGHESSREPTSATGVELLYGGPIDPALRNDYVLFKQSLEPLMLSRFRFLPQPAPREGSLVLTSSDVHDATGADRPARTVGTLWVGHTVVRGVYVTIEATSKPLLLEAARSLEEGAKP